MRRFRLLSALLLMLPLLPLLPLSASAQSPDRGPILVELFTSEGCSSCPPADALLAKLRAEHAEVIVLSEHVTYWNQLGWRDPYSLDRATERQQAYAQRFRLDGPYTPQMVVNGRQEFVGSDRRALTKALAAPSPAGSPTPSVTLSSASSSAGPCVDVETADAPAGSQVVAMLVQNEGHQQVARGENGGRTLSHVNIVREFQTLPAHKGRACFTLPADAGAARDVHFVAILQGPGGPVLASASTQKP